MDRVLDDSLCLLQQLNRSGRLSQDEQMLVGVLRMVQDVANELTTLDAELASLRGFLASAGDDNLMVHLNFLWAAWQRVTVTLGPILMATDATLGNVTRHCCTLSSLADMISCRLLDGQALFQLDDIRQQLVRLHEKRTRIVLRIQEVQKLLEDLSLLESLGGSLQNLNIAFTP
jgi:hypothetical protein